MTSFIIKNQINNLEELKTFNEDGYEFCEDMSNEKEYVYIL